MTDAQRAEAEAARDSAESDVDRPHVADREPTPEEERLADEAAASVDIEEVAKHEREMDRLGAEVRGEGQID